MSFFGTKQTLILGGGNRIVACNPYHRLVYVFSIFNVQTNLLCLKFLEMLLIIRHNIILISNLKMIIGDI
jgi:hypothetical protein